MDHTQDQQLQGERTMMIHGVEHEVEIRVNVHFNASHSLPMRPELHLHVWDVEFSVSGPLNPETGMVCDFLELSEFFKPHVCTLDGSNLHEAPELEGLDGLLGLTAKYPTCDTLAHYLLWKVLPHFEKEPGFRGLRISQVKVSIFEPGTPEAWGHAIIRPKA